MREHAVFTDVHSARSAMKKNSIFAPQFSAPPQASFAACLVPVSREHRLEVQIQVRCPCGRHPFSE